MGPAADDDDDDGEEETEDGAASTEQLPRQTNALDFYKTSYYLQLYVYENMHSCRHS